MSKIDEAIGILKSMGLPREQQNERSALTLLALTDLKEESSWSNAKQRMIRIHDILSYVQEFYGKEYAENTRETIRRQTLHQFMQAGVVAINPDGPSRPTNSPKTVYALTDEAIEVIRRYATKDWQSSLKKFVECKGKLVDKYEKRKRKRQISLELPSGSSISLSPGKHNELQLKVLKEFRSSFFPRAELIYVGDTARKLLYLNEDLARNLEIPITEHDKLPDVVLFDNSKDYLILIEAVTSHGPITSKRQVELEKTLEKCKARKIYVSVFPDFHELKRHIDKIAWETEIWIAEHPSHMIHFNGPKFLTVY